MIEMKANKGFSLVELLVSMTILIMVTLIGTYGYNLYARYWQKELGHYQTTFAQIRDVSRLHNIVTSIKPYIIKDAKGNAFHYFEGAQTVIRSVITSSLSNPDYPAIFELQVVDSGGVKSLLYKEKVMEEAPLLFESQIDDYDTQFKLLDNFSSITFEFFGWQHYRERAGALSGESDTYAPQAWFGAYSGKDTLVPPNIVKLRFVTSQKNVTTFELPIAEISEEQLEFYLSDD